MEWKDDYSIGILEIDDQHKLLMRGFSAIEEAIVRNSGWSDTHYAIVTFMQDWLATHILANDRAYAKHILSGAQLVRSGPVSFI